MKFHFSRKRIIFLIIGAILILTSTIFLILILSKDEKFFDDSALRLSAVEIPINDNGFYDFSQAVNKLSLAAGNTEVFNNMVQGKAWDNNLARQILADNKELLTYFRKTIDYPKFQVPNFQDIGVLTIDTPIPLMGEWRLVANMASLNSLYLFKQGKEKEAFDESIRIIKLGQLIANAPRPISIQYLLGMAIQRLGIENLKIMISSTSLSQGTLRFYIKELENTQITKEQGGIILKEEYVVLSNSLSLLEKEARKSLESESIAWGLLDNFPYYYKPNKTKKLFFEYYLKQNSNFDKKYYSETNFPGFEEFLAPVSSVGRKLTENLVGKIIYDQSMINLNRLFSLSCEQNFLISSTQILLALKAYKIEKGRLPDSLDALVPNYIPEVPSDPFDGHPVRFSNSKRIIYSVGEDLKENEGFDEDPFLSIDF